MNSKIMRFNETIYSIILPTIVIIATIYLLFNYFFESLYGYKFVDSKISTDGRHTITQFAALDYNQYAPYGRILVLANDKVSSPEKGHVIFGGWCSYGINYDWKSPESIEIVCDMSHEESIYTASTIARGIAITIQKVLHPNDSLKDAPDSQYIVGRWGCDTEKTLAELNSRDDAPSSLIKSLQNGCGYFKEIEFTPTTRKKIDSNSKLKIEEPFGYIAKDKNENEIVVNTKTNGSDIEYTFVKVSENSMYIEKDSDGFKWKKYLKRIK